MDVDTELHQSFFGLPPQQIQATTLADQGNEVQLPDTLANEAAATEPQEVTTMTEVSPSLPPSNPSKEELGREDSIGAISQVPVNRSSEDSRVLKQEEFFDPSQSNTINNNNESIPTKAFKKKRIGPIRDPILLRFMGVDASHPKIQDTSNEPSNSSFFADLDIDNLEEKPWEAKNADITDWFNYGFTEESWREYCIAQVKWRKFLKYKPSTSHHLGASANAGINFATGVGALAASGANIGVTTGIAMSAPYTTSHFNESNGGAFVVPHHGHH
ncbi:hypothetical protein RFI_08237, partial [Reticulomyxa filosa]